MSEIENRVTTLERELAALRERLGMEAGLRASQDGDLSDMRLSLQGLNHLVQALSITQSQHSGWLAQHGADLNELKAGQVTIIGLLTRLINADEGERPA